MTGFFDRVVPHMILQCPVPACRTSQWVPVYPEAGEGGNPYAAPGSIIPYKLSSHIILLSKGKRIGGFLSQTIVSDIPGHVSSFCTVIIVVLRVLGMYFGQETSMSFVIHRITTAGAINTIAGSAPLLVQLLKEKMDVQFITPEYQSYTGPLPPTQHYRRMARYLKRKSSQQGTQLVRKLWLMKRTE